MIVVDYPTIEDDDAGLLFSGLHRRATVIHKLLRTARIHGNDCSFASVCSCVIRSKSVIDMSDYTYCSNFYLKQAIADINPSGILAFGSAAGEIITGTRIMNIENSREEIYSCGEIPVVVTYQLGVISGKGCSSCGSASTYSHFVRVDLDRIVSIIKGKGVKFRR